MRSRVELALRALGLAALMVALVQSLVPRDASPFTRTLTPAQLPAVLAAAEPLPDSIVLVADTALDPHYRDWLAAARDAGLGVRWSGDSIPALALAVDPVPDPAGGSRVAVAGPARAVLQLADSAGALDSVRVTGGGAWFEVPRLLGSARAVVGRQHALGGPADSLLSRRIVVLGRPSWETKFVVAALEERGWRVDARIPLTPDTAVVQGQPLRLDTATVAAVIVLDASGGSEAGRVARFVSQGGGVILGTEAAALAGFAPLRAGRPGAPEAAQVLELPLSDPGRALPLTPVAVLAPGAVPLERRGNAVALAGRRVGAGRVIQVGYGDTWRWRMSGPEGAEAAHRRWWSVLVGSVAYRPTLQLGRDVSSHDAPRARMAARLGPAVPGSAPGSSSHSPRSRGAAGWLLAVALVSLLAEWGLRRLRGLA